MYANQSINLCQSEVRIVTCVHVARVPVIHNSLQTPLDEF